jgi:hypothetical protein
MAVTLAQAAVLSQNDLQRGVLEMFVQESPVLDRLPLLEIQGNAYAYNAESALPGVAFRNVNEAYTESTGVVVQLTEALVILGGDADVDRFIVQTRGNVNDQRAVQTAMKVKAASYRFQDAFFNNDVAAGGEAAKGFDGLKKRLTGGQVISTGTNGAALMTDATTMNAFFDNLDRLIAAVPGINAGNGALYANAAILSKVRSIGRRLGGVDIIQEDITRKRILTWNGIPFLDPGQNLAGTDILPQTETQGASSIASSIYAVKFGQDESDRGVTGLTNGGVQVDDMGMLDVMPVLRTRIEFYCGLATFGGKAAARMTGVLNS